MLQCHPHPNEFVDTTRKGRRGRHCAFFMGLQRTEGMLKQFDIRATVDEFRQSVGMYMMWKPGMKLYVSHVRRKQIPAYVFSNGLRPAPIKRRRESLVEEIKPSERIGLGQGDSPPSGERPSPLPIAGAVREVVVLGVRTASAEEAAFNAVTSGPVGEYVPDEEEELDGLDEAGEVAAAVLIGSGSLEAFVDGEPSGMDLEETGVGRGMPDGSPSLSRPSASSLQNGNLDELEVSQSDLYIFLRLLVEYVMVVPIYDMCATHWFAITCTFWFSCL